MLEFGWSPLVLLFPTTIVSVPTYSIVFFFSSQARSRYLSLFSLSFSLTSGQPEQQNPLKAGSFFFICHLAKIRWSIFISKSLRSSCLSFSRTDTGSCIYHLFVRSYLKFLHILQWITHSNQSCLLLYSLCTKLLHSLVMWLIVSSLSPHNLNLIFCCVWSIFLIIYSIRVFHINANLWSSTGVWVTTSLLKSPGLFLVFWPFSITLSFGWSPLIRQLPSPPIPLMILYLLYQKHQLQLA